MTKPDVRLFGDRKGRVTGRGTRPGEQRFRYPPDDEVTEVTCTPGPPGDTRPAGTGQGRPSAGGNAGAKR